jgi:hypothetical protein
VALITKTRWDDYITATLTLLSNGESASAQSAGFPPTAMQWTGILELRSTATNAHELEKFPLDVIRIFTGRVLESVSPQASSTGVEPSVPPLSLATMAADPFVTPKLDSPPLFASDFQPVETRLPQGVNFDANDWSSPSALQQKPVAATSAADPWL